MDKNTVIRKKLIEKRLAEHSIHQQITYLPYLDFDSETFAKPFDVGCRLIILHAITYTVHNMGDRQFVAEWLKKENIWNHVSPIEKRLFEGETTEQRELVDFSWKIEASYVLAWSLNLISDLSVDCSPMSDKQYDEYTSALPLIGDGLTAFLSGLKYIDKAKIIDENLFNELATTYFRDLYFNGNKNESDIDKTVSFERHKALNWLRRFSGIEDWDDTDTST